MLLETLLSFVIGLAIILIAAQLFLKIAEKLAVQWKLSPLFVSVVVLALGANLPEATVTISSLLNEDPGLAMGNLLGSSILNITLILGLGIVLGSVRIGTKKTQYNAAFLLWHIFLLVGLKFSSVEPIYRGITLITSMVITLVFQYVLAANGRTHEDKKFFSSLKKISQKQPGVRWYLAGFGIAASIAGLVTGGTLVISSIDTLSALLNLSTTILGLTLTAVATSFPELILTVVAALKGENKVVVGTLIGSTLFNISLLPGLILLFSQPADIEPIEFIFLLLAGTAAASLIYFYKGMTVPKVAGVVLIGIFTLFMMTTFALAAA